MLLRRFTLEGADLVLQLLDLIAVVLVSKLDVALLLPLRAFSLLHHDDFLYFRWLLLR